MPRASVSSQMQSIRIIAGVHASTGHSLLHLPPTSAGSRSCGDGGSRCGSLPRRKPRIERATPASAGEMRAVFRSTGGRPPTFAIDEHMGVDAMAQDHAGNRVAGQAARLHDLRLAGLGIRSTLHDFPLESLERVSTINRWTPSVGLAGSIQTGCPGGYGVITIRLPKNEGIATKKETPPPFGERGFIYSLSVSGASPEERVQHRLAFRLPERNRSRTTDGQRKRQSGR